MATGYAGGGNFQQRGGLSGRCFFWGVTGEREPGPTGGVDHRMRMNREQRARLFALYQDVCVLCKGAQPARTERMPGTDEQAERMLGEIRSLLHIDRTDVPLSVLEENVAELSARRKARQQLDRLVEQRMARAEKEYYDSVRLELIGEMNGAENAGTRRKLAELIVREGISLTSPAFAQARPRRPKLPQAITPGAREISLL